MKIQIKRIYDDPAKGDGVRILVDRLWPRGVSKERASLDAWVKKIAPSTNLRKWFDHDPEKWEEFSRRYIEEIQENEEAIDELRDLAKKTTLTLLYAAKDEEHNEALVLKHYLDKVL